VRISSALLPHETIIWTGAWMATLEAGSRFQAGMRAGELGPAH
jgi:hypothetical protein